MLGENDPFPPKIIDLIYKNDKLNQIEIKYINKKLKVRALRLFLSMRYSPNPELYDKMFKRELLSELRRKRYE
tara:strand:- start:666 stop:884 length:219 start_codon:yes stop_codon:yes gene_type:complete